MTTNTNAAQVANNLIAVAEDQAFEAWYKQDCLVGGVNARIAARAAWNARAALTTAAAQPPEGWVMVPVEPTLDMGWAYLDAARDQDPLREHVFNHDGYRAMLAAAPKAEPVPAGEYPPLPTGSAWCGDDDVRDFGAGPGESALMFEPTQTQHVPLFTAGQMRAYVDADRAMRAQAAPQPAVQQGDASPTMPKDIEMMATNRYRPVPSGVLAYKVVGGDGNRALFFGTKGECQSVAGRLTEAFLDGAHVALSTHPAAPVAQGDAEDAARLDWLLLRISGAEFRRIGVCYSGNARRADVDAARSQAKEGA